MKIRPVILCGGAGTRLWTKSKNNKPKQFIDFGGWTLIQKTLERVKAKLYDYPIISTNKIYLKELKKHLIRSNIKKYIIILEPSKKNTAPAILSSALLKEIPYSQPLLFLAADHLIEKKDSFNKIINKNKVYLTDKNLFIFGIKPNFPSTEYGYFISKKKNKYINEITKFIEKPKIDIAKKIIKNKGYWNSGIIFTRKDSLIRNFKIYQPSIYKNCLKSINNVKVKNKIYSLKKKIFNKNPIKSFDYAILEKLKKINAIKLNIPWSDLGSWIEISKMYSKNIKKYYNRNNLYLKPWGRYVNLFIGKGFMVKELYIKYKGRLSLQKHFHRSEHWLITHGIAKITLNKKIVIKKANESIYIPKGSIHRVENSHKKPLKIIEIQLGSILKENDIVRYQDIYGRIK